MSREMLSPNLKIDQKAMFLPVVSHLQVFSNICIILP